MKSGSRSPCAKQHLRFASIPIQHLPLMRQRNALGGASIHLLLQISPNGDAFLHTKWGSRRRNLLEDQFIACLGIKIPPGTTSGVVRCASGPLWQQQEAAYRPICLAVSNAFQWPVGSTCPRGPPPTSGQCKPADSTRRSFNHNGLGLRGTPSGHSSAARSQPPRSAAAR